MSSGSSEVASTGIWIPRNRKGLSNDKASFDSAKANALSMHFLKPRGSKGCGICIFGCSKTWEQNNKSPCSQAEKFSPTSSEGFREHKPVALYRGELSRQATPMSLLLLPLPSKSTVVQIDIRSGCILELIPLRISPLQISRHAQSGISTGKVANNPTE